VSDAWKTSNGIMRDYWGEHTQAQ